MEDASCGFAQERAPETAAQEGFASALLDAVAVSSGTADVLCRAAAAVTLSFGEWAVIWLSERVGHYHPRHATSHRDPQRRELVSRLAGQWTETSKRALFRRAAASTGATFLNLNSPDVANGTFGPAAPQWRGLGSARLLLAPLGAAPSQFGFLLVACPAQETLAEPRAVALVETVARQLSAAIDHYERFDIARQANRQLIVAGLRLQTILESIPQGVIVADAPMARVISSNHSLADLIGRPLEPGMPPRRYTSLLGLAKANGQSYLPEEVPWVRTARYGERVFGEEMIVVHADGRPLSVLCSSSAMRDQTGRIAEVVAILNDISARKQLEREKDEFLAITAHELRTPITSLRGFTDLLLRRFQGPAPPPFGSTELGILRILDKQVRRLQHLTGDLLNLSAIQMGRLQLRRSPLNLGDFVREQVGRWQRTRADRRFAVFVLGDTQATVDPLRMGEVVDHLVSNAIKATRRDDKIEVTVRGTERTVLTSVHDSGPGISPEIRERVFDRFYRGPDRLHEGMGLGLYVAKVIVVAHGGTLWVDSRVGEGATFHFEVPATRRQNYVAGGSGS